MRLEDKLKSYFSFDSFREGQKEVITALMNKENTLAMLPTGTGKSLCYQLPGKLMDGAVLIISPLLSLMQDQVQQMKMLGEKKVVALNSFLSPIEKRKIYETIYAYKYIYISPEMIVQPNIIQMLKGMKICLFVIDEAHCISQWGYDFRPDYQSLGYVRKELGNPLTLLLTATATQVVREDIKQSLCLEAKEIIYSVNRPNIALKVEQLASPHEKLKKLKQYVGVLQGPGIIYFSSKRLVEEMAAYLKREANKTVVGYHGGMSQEDRILIQEQFLSGQIDVICATSAFGMGINKENVRYVIHYHLPTQIESYLQEIGRAGRDKKPSIAILLYTQGDEWLTHQLIESELPNEHQLTQWKKTLKQYASYKDWLDQNNLMLFHYFSETQWRVLEAFLEPINKTVTQLHPLIDDFVTFREKRGIEKRRKVDALVEWIQSKACRRLFVANYFKEEYIPMQTNCCDCCGLQITEYYQKEDKKKNVQINQNIDWKKQLAMVLRVKSEQIHEKK